MGEKRGGRKGDNARTGTGNEEREKSWGEKTGSKQNRGRGFSERRTGVRQNARMRGFKKGGKGFEGHQLF